MHGSSFYQIGLALVSIDQFVQNLVYMYSMALEIGIPLFGAIYTLLMKLCGD